MQFGNTDNSYGFAARALHWTTALVILAAFPLGILANGQDLTTDDGIRRAFLLFSLHKTTGVLAFALGIIRLFWRLSQPRPAPIHPERRLENFAAGTVHWMLTIALIIVPLAGWISHSATPELAPIWWPFGQSLPFVPVDDAVAQKSATIHWLFTKILLAAVVLHIAGALKHLLRDKDDVLVRMWRGTASGPLGNKRQIAPASVALMIWAAALSTGLLLDDSQTRQAAPVTQEWPLADAEVVLIDGSGQVLATASAYGFILVFDPNSRNEVKGTLDLTVPLDALVGPGAEDILATAPFPLLQFLGTVTGETPAFSAVGNLEIGGETVEANFDLIIETSGAQVTGVAALPLFPDVFLSINASAIKP